jgi:hypothetical protein
MAMSLLAQESEVIEMDFGLDSENDVNIYNLILGEKNAVDNPNNAISEAWMDFLNTETELTYY